MALPNFIVIGAMRAGTTSLYRYLESHPQIFMPVNKELHFFTEDMAWRLGWDWYEQQFADAGAAKAIGEASPSYSAFPRRPGVPARIAAALPDARLIYLMRHPLERARSEYRHQVHRGWEKLPIGRALLENPTYVTKSSYALQIGKYLEHFSREQLLLLITEELTSDRDRVLEQTFAFLGVDASWRSPVFSRKFYVADEIGPQIKARAAARRLGEKLPFARSVARRYPRLVRTVFRTYGVLSRRADSTEVEISEAARREFENRLRPDLERLQLIVPNALDIWGMKLVSN